MRVCVRLAAVIHQLLWSITLRICGQENREWRDRPSMALIPDDPAFAALRERIASQVCCAHEGMPLMTFFWPLASCFLHSCSKPADHDAANGNHAPVSILQVAYCVSMDLACLLESSH